MRPLRPFWAVKLMSAKEARFNSPWSATVLTVFAKSLVLLVAVIVRLPGEVMGKPPVWMVLTAGKLAHWETLETAPNWTGCPL